MPSTVPQTVDAEQLLHRYDRVRSFTRRICGPLQKEDYVVQSMPDVSPTRWHLAHTTWFFETFVLEPFVRDYRFVDQAYCHLFNSYYQTVGDPYPRARRGVLSRPTVDEVWAYRQIVDECMAELLDHPEVSSELAQVVELGLQHEQQHQELILTDIKHVLSCNPLWPAYHDRELTVPAVPDVAHWKSYAAGVPSIGNAGDTFCFDNEMPRHEILLRDYRLQDRLVTNREYLAFIDDGGYRRPELWLSMGWSAIVSNQWSAPLYWQLRDGQWLEFTLSGAVPLDEHAPVTHVSYFEADAFARWAGSRLPTEGEWELAAAAEPREGTFAESLRFHPHPAAQANGLRQVFGDVWEWTASPYTAYPGYAPLAGSLGEYNGKFMCNQFVLRGGSCVTSETHIRATYRNFFPPEARWQFSGIRLAQ